MIPLLYLLSACLAVEPGSDQILARDLAPAFPALATVDPATPLAYAPAPGVSRTLRVPELHTLATRFHLMDAPDREICFERAVTPLDPAKLLSVMQAALPEGRIEILEYSRLPAPAGDIRFPREGLRAEAANHQGAVWNGFVQYAGNRHFAIWARVNVQVTMHRVLSIGDLTAGRAVEAGQIMLQTRDEFPAPGKFAETLEEVAGKWPRVAIRAGVEIRIDQLRDPKEVSRGDTVRVDVSAGAAHLELEGVAESAGAVGEVISVRNPISNKRFRARVEAPGRVSVAGATVKGTQ
ncbi:MAG TPA: flagellar basal body P-ring formation chaperone FlgA [Candidatus Sulfopaludibacter sp.]|jgi:flagella basal body P-ring formation protein FlgA|nr:flagellar basal body P-ring formation chaperone FlgA [Candidatus Sulfopaludibacter sp.]